MTKTLIVGAGSIGIRHAEVIASLGFELAIVSSRTDLVEHTFNSIEEAVSEFKPDYVVLANQTAKHSQAFEELMSTGFSGRVLLEKPANIDYKTFSSASFGSVHIAYNLRFHPVLIALRDELEGQKVLSVQAYVGQDLNTWRPGRAVDEQYSAHTEQGGGVLRDLSHELDYLQWMFGKVLKLTALGGRIGNVTVNSDDSWSIILLMEQVPQVSLSMNYFDIPGSRNLRVITGKDTYFADFVAGTLTKNGKVFKSFSVNQNDTYIAMHKDVLTNGALAANIESALETDRLTLDIELSSKQQIWIIR